MRAAAARTPPFRLALGQAFYVGSPADGCSRVLMLIGPRESGGAPCRVHVVWTTRTHPAHTTLDPVWPPPHAARQPTASHQPLEFSGALLPADISEFAAPALERHEHAVALMIELGYYVNRETTTDSHRLPKRLMPKLW